MTCLNKLHMEECETLEVFVFGICALKALEGYHLLMQIFEDNT